MEWLIPLMTLICPIMMIFCMFGMHKGKGKGSCCSKKESEVENSLNHLKNENDELREELNQLKRELKIN